MSFNSKEVERAANAIINSDGLIIGAGAGMGVDSGLPDFRGNQGFWKAYPALGKAQMVFTEMANPQLFSVNPELAWGFYGHRFNLYQNTVPHSGFNILRRIASQLEFGYQVFTSNVDGQFQAAGFDESHIYECHGSINYLQCSKPCNEKIWKARDLKLEIDHDNCLATSGIQKCPNCGSIIRPNILMFNDFSWIARRSDQQQSNLRNNIRKMKNPVVIECGAGTAIPTVRYFCEAQACPVIRINPREAKISNIRGISLACGALEGLTAISDKLFDKNFWNCNKDK